MTVKTAGLAKFLEQIGVPSGEAQKAVDVLSEMEIGKSAPPSQPLAPEEIVIDQWHRGQRDRVPTADEIKTGAPQYSSGSGAERMVRTYSDPAPQGPLVTVPERLAAELGNFHGMFKSLEARLAVQDRNINALTQVSTAILTKAAEEHEEDKGKDKGEEKRFGEAAARKANDLFAGARRMLAKAATLGADLDDLEGDARKSRKAEMRDLEQRAAKLLVKAHNAAFAARPYNAEGVAAVFSGIDELLGANPVIKSHVSMLVEKASLRNEEAAVEKAFKKIAREAEKKVEKKKAKAAKKAAAVAGNGPAAPPAAAETATKSSEPPVGTAPGTAPGAGDAPKIAATVSEEKIAAVQAEVTKALAGLTTLTGTVRDMMDIVRGAPAAPPQVGAPLTLIKGGAEGGMNYLRYMQRIEEMADTGQLDSGTEMRARDVLSKLGAVAKGSISKEVVDVYLQNSPEIVQQIFREPEAAA